MNGLWAGNWGRGRELARIEVLENAFRDGRGRELGRWQLTERCAECSLRRIAICIHPEERVPNVETLVAI